MPAVFVHGVPDTPRVWHAVVARLGRRDVVTVSLPGFGRPAPAGFEPTKDAYVRWRLGCGHWWPLERPEAVAQELKGFWPTKAGSG